ACLPLPSCPHGDDPDISLLRLRLLSAMRRAEATVLVLLADVWQASGLLAGGGASPAVPLASVIALSYPATRSQSCRAPHRYGEPMATRRAPMAIGAQHSWRGAVPCPPLAMALRCPPQAVDAWLLATAARHAVIHRKAVPPWDGQPLSEAFT